MVGTVTDFQNQEVSQFVRIHAFFIIITNDYEIFVYVLFRKIGWLFFFYVFLIITSAIMKLKYSRSRSFLLVSIILLRNYDNTDNSGDENENKVPWSLITIPN